MKKNMNEMNSIGKYLAEGVNQLKSCRSKWEVINLANHMLSFHMEDPIVKRDYPEFIAELKKCNTLAEAYMYYVNYVLAGDGLKVIK